MRLSVRLRLTLLYGALFLGSGLVLLAITYVLVTRQPVHAEGGGFIPAGSDATPAPLPGLDELTSRVATQRRDFLVQAAVSLAIMTLLSIGLGWIMAGRVLRPLRTITATARGISAHQLDRRLRLSGPQDELKELGDTFDELLGRLQAAFEAQRQFSANASHELRTPLTRARTLLEVALADPEPSVNGLQGTCRRVLAATEQQERLIEALLTLARGERGLAEAEVVDVAAITGEVLGAQARFRDVRMEAVLGNATVRGDRRLLERLVTNLVDNAVRYNVVGGEVTVTSGTRARGGAVLAVANTGPEVAGHDIERLVRPFQRQRHDRAAGSDGHGLGLAIVHAIAEAHGARLHAAARPGGGLRVEIVFPPVTGTAKAGRYAGSGVPSRPPGNRE
jgi:signal transduction histidine kinase